MKIILCLTLLLLLSADQGLAQSSIIERVKTFAGDLTVTETKLDEVGGPKSYSLRLNGQSIDGERDIYNLWIVSYFKMFPIEMLLVETDPSGGNRSGIFYKIITIRSNVVTDRPTYSISQTFGNGLLPSIFKAGENVTFTFPAGGTVEGRVGMQTWIWRGGQNYGVLQRANKRKR